MNTFFSNAFGSALIAFACIGSMVLVRNAVAEDPHLPVPCVLRVLCEEDPNMCWGIDMCLRDLNTRGHFKTSLRR
jgi:hypothetical protein